MLQLCLCVCVRALVAPAVLISAGTDGPARALPRLRSPSSMRGLVKVQCECVIVCVLLVSSSIFPSLIYCRLHGTEAILHATVHTHGPSDTDCCSVSDFLVVFGLYLFAPLTLSSLIPLERLFTAKLMFANTQSRHTQYPFVCVCVFVRAGLCICNWF